MKRNTKYVGLDVHQAMTVATVGGMSVSGYSQRTVRRGVSAMRSSYV